MSQPDDPERPPVTPPPLPPDVLDIPQNPSSELQPPPDPAARPDQVAGAAPGALTAEISSDPVKAELRDKTTPNSKRRFKIRPPGSGRSAFWSRTLAPGPRSFRSCAQGSPASSR